MESRKVVARAVADAIVSLAREDPALVDRVIADPVSALDPLGVSPALAGLVAAELESGSEDGEVSGYVKVVKCSQTVCPLGHVLVRNPDPSKSYCTSR